MASATRNGSNGSSKPLRVLCIDGGGVRGVIPIQCLIQIQDHLSRHTNTLQEPHEIFDVICGTSTGGILAVMLGILKVPLKDCIDIYRKLSNELFPQAYIAAKIMKVLFGKSLYDSRVLESKAKDLLCQFIKAEATVRDPLDDDLHTEYIKMCDDRVKAEFGKTPHVFLVSSVGERPFLLRNYAAPCDCSNMGTNDITIVEAIRATSAAPVYYDKAESGEEEYCIDGGVGFNNPIFCVAAELAQVKQFQTPKKFILSLGTGSDDVSPYAGRHYVQIAQHALKVVTGTEWTHECFRDLIENDETVIYRRLNPTEIGDIDLDRADKIDDLVKRTKKYLRKEREKLSQIANDLECPRYTSVCEKFVTKEQLDNVMKQFDTKLRTSEERHQDQQKQQADFDEKLQKQIRDLELKYDELFKTYAGIMEQVKEKDKKINALQTTIESLEAKLRAADERCAELEAEKVKRESAIACIKADLRIERSERDELAETGVVTSEKLNELKNSINAAIDSQENENLRSLNDQGLGALSRLLQTLPSTAVLDTS